MKIRTDFVTNSSSSSFVTFRIENSVLASLFKKAKLYYYLDLQSANRNIVRGQLSFESVSAADIPGNNSLSDWLLDQIEKVLEETPFSDEFTELMKLIKENRKDIDRSTKRATFSSRQLVTDDWGSAFYHQENRGGKIYYVGFDEDDWDNADLTKETGRSIDDFILFDDERIVRLANEKFKNHCRVSNDPYYEDNDNSVFDNASGVSFEGQVVCLTGDFDYGSKADVTNYITARGGSCSSSVTAKTTIVLAGNKGSENWAYGNYGTKVAKAIERKKQGDSILVIKENASLFEDKEKRENRSVLSPEDNNKSKVPETEKKKAVEEKKENKPVLSPNDNDKSKVSETEKKNVDEEKKKIKAASGFVSAAELKKLWMIKDIDSTSVKICLYKGREDNVEIPSRIGKKDVIQIADQAFSCINSIVSVMIPDSVTSIGYNAFHHCTSLSSVTIPDSVTSIGASAFSDCTLLTSVTIPDNVTKINVFAFYGCTSLTDVTIPNSVTEIGGGAFGGCSSLVRINISPDNPSFLVIDDSIYSKGKETLISHYGCKADVVIPDGVMEIGERAFVNSTSLKSVKIPNGVTTIGDCAFGSCKSLTSVIIPDSVTSIGENAFYNCTSLTIHTPAGSCAEKYAKDNGISFEIL